MRRWRRWTWRARRRAQRKADGEAPGTCAQQPAGSVCSEAALGLGGGAGDDGGGGVDRRGSPGGLRLDASAGGEEPLSGAAAWVGAGDRVVSGSGEGAQTGGAGGGAGEVARVPAGGGAELAGSGGGADGCDGGDVGASGPGCDWE